MRTIQIDQMLHLVDSRAASGSTNLSLSRHDGLLAGAMPIWLLSSFPAQVALYLDEYDQCHVPGLSRQIRTLANGGLERVAGIEPA